MSQMLVSRIIYLELLFILRSTVGAAEGKVVTTALSELFASEVNYKGKHFPGSIQ